MDVHHQRRAVLGQSLYRYHCPYIVI